ncbi:protein CHUP1, chloroplastic [Macadamia integrifolia]|uniref:protein CHUP1, chloroplastic n=1 Tax=Macadamia integrifolia TaxID=60698 RepID=UPI001C5305E2|nr:protein CHUP1, chloroplastic [Macadamia integrifolia]
MESSGSKTVLTKPILLKAGIPLALSLGGLIYTMITTRRTPPPEVPPAETQVDDLPETDYHEEFPDRESFHSLDSYSLPSKEEAEQISYNQVTNSLESLLIRDGHDLEEELFSIRRWLIALEDKERELEMQFFHYCSLKEQESIIMELRNALTSEISRLELLALEAKLIEAENQRLEAVVVENQRIVEQLKSARVENGLLQRKVKKLLRNTRAHSRVLRQQASALQSTDDEILRNEKELERSSQVIKELEEEIMELRRILDQLKEEKKELVEKLELAESLASSTSKEKMQETENGDHDQLLTKLEQLQKDRAAEVEELIYLRWINACLRHELFRNQQQQRTHHEEEGEEVVEVVEEEKALILELEANEEKKDCGLEYDTDGSSTTVSKHQESCLGITRGSDHPFSKRQRLLRKLKRWVEGSEKCKKLWDEDKHLQHNEGTSIRRQSGSYGAIEQHQAARKSCSSV